MKKSQLVNLKIKDIIKSFLDENITPHDIRLQAAKGLIPLETDELVTSFYYFKFDRDDDIRQAASESLSSLPDNMLKNFLATDIPEEILDYFAKKKMGDESILEIIILNKNVSTDTLRHLSGTVSEKLALMIADNQEKIIKDPGIIDRLEQNSNIHKSLIEKLRSFLDLFAPTKEEKAEEEFKEIKVEELIQEAPAPEEPMEEAAPEEPSGIEEELADYEKSVVAFPEGDDLSKYSEEEIEEITLNTYQRIQSMNVAEKIQEALKGSRESRSILIKDSNKLVSSAVVKSPKITEDEIVKISASRSVNEEVLRLICMKEEWLRNYQVKLNLVSNPKTPLGTALKFMNYIRKKDLNILSKSKMVPTVIATTAKKLMARKGN